MLSMQAHVPEEEAEDTVQQVKSELSRLMEAEHAQDRLGEPIGWENWELEGSLNWVTSRVVLIVEASYAYWKRTAQTG